MNEAIEKMKILAGIEVEDAATSNYENEGSRSFAFLDDFDATCTLSAKQVAHSSIRLFSIIIDFFSFSHCFCLVAIVLSLDDSLKQPLMKLRLMQIRKVCGLASFIFLEDDRNLYPFLI